MAIIGPTLAKVAAITTGRRMPKPPSPSDCTSVASPQQNRSALTRKAVSSRDRCSAPATINGTATAPAYITSTCWIASSHSGPAGGTASIGEGEGRARDIGGLDGGEA